MADLRFMMCLNEKGRLKTEFQTACRVIIHLPIHQQSRNMEGRILDAQFEKAFPARLPKRIFGTCRWLFLFAENQRQHRQDQEADKQDFGNACRTARDAAETQYGCNDGDNEENDCIM